ncbi:MAG: type IV pilus modification protein PilV [Methylovulum sp.]|nr:type IV pilus modification protein PilV [Methylovulum sp.]
MKPASGFTLIEILVALVVLSGGLLGLAALQATSLNNNQSAYNRSQATLLAYDIADRIRANVVNANLLSTSAYIAAPPYAAQTDCMSVSASCTAADMAQNDLYEWNNVIATTLPGCNSVQCASIAVNGTLFTVTIQWDDNHDGDVDGDGGANEGDIDGDGDTDDDPSFQMSLGL